MSFDIPCIFFLPKYSNSNRFFVKLYVLSDIAISLGFAAMDSRREAILTVLPRTV